MNEIGIEIDNNINQEITRTIKQEQQSFLQTTLGKVVNSAIDIGLKTILPDLIENQIIDIKNTILENGFSAGIKEVIDSSIDTGKSLIGIATGEFENIAQIEMAVKKGGILDQISGLLDYSINFANKRNLIDNNISSVIKKGKNTIISSISNKIEETLTNQIKAVEKVEKNCEKWKESYGNKDFFEMEKSYKLIKNSLSKIIPLENIIKEARSIENMHELIKNNEMNFDLSSETMQLAQKLI